MYNSVAMHSSAHGSRVCGEVSHFLGPTSEKEQRPNSHKSTPLYCAVGRLIESVTPSPSVFVCQRWAHVPLPFVYPSPPCPTNNWVLKKNGLKGVFVGHTVRCTPTKHATTDEMENFNINVYYSCIG